jgi:predicted dehydrogenase
MNNKTKLRWGILGAARINERLMPAIVEASNAELVAIASRRPGAAAQTLAQYAPHQQQVKTYDNPEALLDDAEIEAVYVPLANHEHADGRCAQLNAVNTCCVKNQWRSLLPTLMQLSLPPTSITSK